MSNRFLLAVVSATLVLLMSLESSAQNAYTDCDGVAGAERTLVSRRHDPICYEFDSAHGTGGTDGFEVLRGARAKVCLDPDQNSSGTSGSAVVDIQVCPPPGAASDNTCLSTGVAELTLSGSNPCAAIVPGRWRFSVTTVPVGAEDAFIEIEGY